MKRGRLAAWAGFGVAAGALGVRRHDPVIEQMEDHFALDRLGITRKILWIFVGAVGAQHFVQLLIPGVHHEGAGIDVERFQSRPRFGADGIPPDTA